MTSDELTAWALANGWQMVGEHPSLMKPSAPHEAIVRLVLKATMASLEIKKPAGRDLVPMRLAYRDVWRWGQSAELMAAR
jgi:hypothetical protein